LALECIKRSTLHGVSRRGRFPEAEDYEDARLPTLDREDAVLVGHVYEARFLPAWVVAA
jgi:hypothetical protein